MKIIKASYEILYWDSSLKLIELAARTCYKSEDRITEDSSAPFIRDKILGPEHPHLSVIEHSMMTVKFVIDRSISHELVRHRLCSFSQESTRYCNYTKGKFDGEVTFIEPCFWGPPGDQLGIPAPPSPTNRGLWEDAMLRAEAYYKQLIANGAKPEQARSVLPNSLKTEIVVTANYREWLHIFKMRTSLRAHPQMREVMVPLLEHVRRLVPVVFDDLEKG